MILTAWLFIKTTIADAFQILQDSAIARYFTLAVVVAILVSGFFFCRGCKSSTEKKVEADDPVIVEQQQAVNSAVNTAIQANVNANAAVEDAKQAQANVNKVIQNRESNVSFQEANKNRCLAFPNAPECK